MRFFASLRTWILLRKKRPCIFLLCKGLSIDDVGVSRDTVFEEVRPGAGFETRDLVKEQFGGGYSRLTQKCYTYRSHPSVKVVLFESNVSDNVNRFRSSSVETLSVSSLILRVRRRMLR